MKQTNRIVASAAVLALAGAGMAQHAGQDEHMHDHAEAHAHESAAGRGARLLVADTADNVVRVIDVDSGAVVGSFTVPGETGGNLIAAPGGQYGVVTHRDANRVSIIHSGLTAEDHGDHAHLIQRAPYVLATMNVGRQPTHLATGEGKVIIFNDQDGAIALLDEQLFGLTLGYDLMETATPDHGAALAVGDFVLAGFLDGARVDVFAADGSVVESQDGCPGLHGAIAVGETAVFGCSDGVLLGELHGDHFHWHHLPNPVGAAEDDRVGTFYGQVDGLAIGNLGSGLALIDVAGQAIAQVSLPAAPVSAAVAGDLVVALTEDGGLVLLEATGGQLGEIDVIDGLVGYDPAAGRPDVTALGGSIFVTDPVAGSIHVLHAGHDGLELAGVIEVPGNPGPIAPLMVEGHFEWH